MVVRRQVVVEWTVCGLRQSHPDAVFMGGDAAATYCSDQARASGSMCFAPRFNSSFIFVATYRFAFMSDFLGTGIP